MANKIIPKRSSVSGKVPATTDLDVGEIAVNLTDRKIYTKDAGGTVVQLGGGAGSGDVVGPNSSTDNAIARFDLATGKLIQNSSATIDDSGNLTATTVNSSGTGADKMTVGTTAQRPATAEIGMYRMNSETGMPEWYDAANTAWVPFYAERPYDIEYIVVAGGGGGMTVRGGGGGAGGYLTGTLSKVPTGTTYTITIGAGGSGAAAGTGLGAASGSNTTLGSVVTAIGGGMSGGSSGASGGSGGGAGGNGGNTGGAGTTGQGYAGGAGAFYGAGGGGGANGVGGNGSTYVAGNGGNGKSDTWSGSTRYLAGGGGGGHQANLSGTAGSGGLGGGGSGGLSNASNATANTGGGGGGGGGDGSSYFAGGNGGSGVVILRYQGSPRGSGGTITQVGGYTIHTFTSSDTFKA